MFLELLVGGFLAVGTCSKALFHLGVGHGKSPWISQPRFPAHFRVDCSVPSFSRADVAVFSECAF